MGTVRGDVRRRYDRDTDKIASIVQRNWRLIREGQAESWEHSHWQKTVNVHTQRANRGGGKRAPSLSVDVAQFDAQNSFAAG